MESELLKPYCHVSFFFFPPPTSFSSSHLFSGGKWVIYFSAVTPLLLLFYAKNSNQTVILCSGYLSRTFGILIVGEKNEKKKKKNTLCNINVHNEHSVTLIHMTTVGFKPEYQTSEFRPYRPYTYGLHYELWSISEIKIKLQLYQKRLL